MAAHYDDPRFSYLSYWQGRDYEHESEIIALETLLSSHHFASAADIGGGYGRLIPTIDQYSSKIFLIEPSAKQRAIAQKLFPSRPDIFIKPGSAESTRLPAASQDLVTMIRVAHHLPDLSPSLIEAHRILKPSGVLVLEFANSAHIKARLSRTAIPLAPIEKRTPKNIRARTIPFMNHHPLTVLSSLSKAGFAPQRILSVSNFRSQFLKKLLPLKVMLILESVSQVALSRLWFGPSIFVLSHRLDTRPNL